MQIPISVCRQSLEDERRNNYQIMHVALLFLNLEALKGKRKNKTTKRGGVCVCVQNRRKSGAQVTPAALLSRWKCVAV